MTGTLYLVATPIGNLEDMTFRAIRTLKEVDLIAAEDTRNSIKLLNHFEIQTPMTSYHEYNKFDKGRKLVEKLEVFRKAYFIHAISPEEYENFGPVVLFRSSFEQAWKNALGVIAELRKQN